MNQDFLSTDYELSEDRIANAPAHKRGSDRLFIYDTVSDTIQHDIFSNIHAYLPKNTLCVLNKSSVVPARIRLNKSSGGSVEVLFLLNEDMPANLLRIMVDRKVTEGITLTTSKNIVIGHVKEHSEKSIFTLQLTMSRSKLMQLLLHEGTAPLPKYIKHSPLSMDERIRRYQTVYAQKNNQLGSIAAPTAGLHFTKKIIEDLIRYGTDIQYVTLHVGLGTFAPLTQEQMETRKLHEELYSISQNTLDALEGAKTQRKPILAVGTTTVRTLESYASTHVSTGSTDIFIYPPYSFYYPTMLLTNFHLPHTSLMLLVQAYLQYKKSKRNLVQLYREAIKGTYMFYSFGDSMLIL
ncbi:MAG: tRNA preQ1(34) S-adenosylmethionine ribosyltransferase-isomerase QueA [Candidatus Roizmanbacteria bacterium]|nr:tRNA preQ1(34) S-adenosylmethionine ribosyltransferase-isomerase QueA [Candidatus Roizmanbacteria bacterium]